MPPADATGRAEGTGFAFRASDAEDPASTLEPVRKETDKAAEGAERPSTRPAKDPGRPRPDGRHAGPGEAPCKGGDS